MFKRIFILLAAFAFSVSAQAVSVDFTGQDWKDAINASSDPTSATVGNVTLSTGYSKHHLNFNGSSSEIRGCAAGSDLHDLACLGDGIGINNDEIGGYYEELLIEFAEAVDVTKIYLLDLFGAETPRYGSAVGEKAIIINSNDVNKTVIGAVDADGDSIAGGFFSVEYSVIEGKGLTSILLKGYKDCFSDFALAGLEIAPSPVPVPGAAILFGSALLGFFGFKRRRVA